MDILPSRVKFKASLVELGRFYLTGVGMQIKGEVTSNEYQNGRPECRTWKSWSFSDKTPGCYDTEDLQSARLLLLQHNISPGVSYRGGEICALHVPLYRQHIYKTPQWAMSLLRWSDELNYNGTMPLIVGNLLPRIRIKLYWRL